MKKYLTLIVILLLIKDGVAQQSTGIIEGKVIDKITKEELPGVNVLIPGTLKGTATDINGNFRITGLEVGVYRLSASYVGYNSATKSDITVATSRPANVLFELIESAIVLEGITVTSDYFYSEPTEVNSIKAFSYEEIRRVPGGFEDVVRALSVLPGIAQASAGRNDLVVRGGAPSENLFLVDGFVVPNINHFGNQGATGGPLSFVNLDYVNETTFSAGGFSAMYGDKLSSVLKIDLRDARKDRIGGKAKISASQFGINMEGPINEKSDFLFSVRRSYLDFIFNAAGFNFVPEYYDVLAKANYNFDKSNKLSYLFIAAFDKVKFNNEDKEDIYDNAKILGSNQNQYVTGISFRHLFDKGFYNLSLSRNFVDYDSFQRDTTLQPIFQNISREAENELKTDLVYKLSPSSELNLGASIKYINFSADILFPENFVTSFGEVLPVTSIDIKKNFMKYGGFVQYSGILMNRLRVNLGLRADYFSAIDNPFTLSPRFSTSYLLDAVSSVSFSTGIYYQTPSYIWLAADEQNKNLDPVRVNQFILGIERRLAQDLRVKLEGFYKDYSNYPTSLLRPYLVLANTGAGYGGSEDNFSTLGLEPLTSAGTGYSRGLEFSMQKKSSDMPMYGILSLTYSQSRFKGLDDVERNGRYDQTWIFNLSTGYVFNEFWEAAVKFRLATGSPYTPYNNDGTKSVTNYLTNRFNPTHSLDLRIDRRWDFDGWRMITYIDIQNVYSQKNVTNVTWDYLNNKPEENSNIGILPSIGIDIEF